MSVRCEGLVSQGVSQIKIDTNNWGELKKQLGAVRKLWGDGGWLRGKGEDGITLNW